MKLTELKVGECGVLLAAPDVLLPSDLRPGGRVQMVMTRPELSVVTAGNAHFALSGDLAGQMIVIRAPT